MLLTFNVDARHLRAALICASRDDVRYYLNGIALEVHKNRVIVLATDGHRLYAGRSSDWDFSIKGDKIPTIATFIVPRAMIEQVLDAGKNVGTIGVWTDGEQVELTRGNSKISGKLIDGRFPDWRRIAPRGDCSNVVAQFNARYLWDCYQIERVFGGRVRAAGSDSMPHVEHNGDRAALVTFPSTADVCVFLMPMRSNSTERAREWLNDEITSGGSE